MSASTSAAAGSTSVKVKGDARGSEGVTLKLNSDSVIGNGSFGVVFEAKIVETGEAVAIKKVLQDKRFRNRELQIMKQLHHPNIVALKHYFYQNGEKEDEIYLNLVLEFVPDTVYKVTKQYNSLRQSPPMIVAKLYVYQMCRSLAHLHALGICHRDIKPQNLLVDTRSHTLKLCDFGSSKELQPGEPSVAYICSRYYRAPELIFGATDYTTAIDLWSAGCVFAEFLLGHPIFPGETGVDQLVEIIKVLGTPTKEQVIAMNKAYTEFHFPSVKAYSWQKLFKTRATDSAIDLIAAMLTYEPQKRISAAAALTHPFFDELRLPTTRLPDGEPLPPLFNFTDEELALFKDAPDTLDILIPPHARNPSNWKKSLRTGAPAAPSSSASSDAASSSAPRAAAGGSGAGAPTAAATTGSSAPRSGSSGAATSGSSTGRDSRTADVTLPSPVAAALASATAAGSSKAAAAGGRLVTTSASASDSTHSAAAATPR